MTIEEAKQALQDGHTITHTYFSHDEHIHLDKIKHKYIDEAGLPLDIELFWAFRTSEGFQKGWRIKEFAKKTKEE